MQNEIISFSDTDQFANYIARIFERLSKTGQKCNIAISGGNTPKIIFDYIINSNFKKSTKWSNLNFFWSDERCVPPEHPDSNYGMAQNLLFKHIGISKKNIHRIQGEFEPVDEAKQYSNDIMEMVPVKNGIPCFDWMLLGIGTDGHTASIFPDSTHVFNSENLCEATTHPETKQKRITLTPKLINNSMHITVIASGEEKLNIIDKIVNKKEEYINYPASLLIPVHGTLEWVIYKT